MRSFILTLVILLGISLIPPAAQAQKGKGQAKKYPNAVEGDFVIKDFRFAKGETLPELRLHYRTFGTPRRDDKGVVRNAVLILHATTGNSSNFLGGIFAGQLFGKGQPLDAEHYYLILPDSIGHGRSSKPSDGLHARFPRYGYHDMITAQHRLLTEHLKVDHVRLVMGTSMGGMHTWLWGQKYPEYMDALLPLASLPGQISGRNRMWRKMISDVIRTDPEWTDGEYQTPPRSLRFAMGLMAFMSSNAVQRQKAAPTLKAADALLERSERSRADANNLLYAVEASWDYDPTPGLKKIRAPLLAINFADDLINPPELGILEREVKNVPCGRAIVIPESERTRGHGTHTMAAIWKEHLVKLLQDSEGAPAQK
jgi:homoserine O-acetyltransferase